MPVYLVSLLGRRERAREKAIRLLAVARNPRRRDQPTRLSSRNDRGGGEEDSGSPSLKKVIQEAIKRKVIQNQMRLSL